MNTITRALLFSHILFAAVSITSCGGNDKKQSADVKKDSNKTPEKKEDKKVADTKYKRPPIVNIVDTLAPKRTVAYYKDSALNFEGIALKLGNIYEVVLPEYVKKNGLKTTGAPMAWYTKDKAPYFFEAGTPVSKAGTKPVKGVLINEMSAGKVVVAHFFGPFELLPQGYDAIREFIKDNKKIVAGTPYEVYLSDPFDKDGKPVDPYKIQTDIVFPVK